MKKILVTGGCGFIGSNFIKYLLSESREEISIVNLDKQTYAGKGKNIEHMGFEEDNRYQFVRGDIADKGLIEKIFLDYNPELVFNFAAESHVDRSIQNPGDSVNTNVMGATNLFDAVKKFKTPRIIQISTDEVYGSTKKESFDENAKLNPSSPYSASKASAELIGLSYFKTHKLPIVITRSSNNYGPYQFPEKFLPLFITNLIEGKKVPLMWSKENPGLNIRDWLHVDENCRAIWFISQKGKNGEIYNISGDNERTNIEMTDMLLKDFGYGDEMIEKIEHRKAHDFRYSINGDKLKKLGFKLEYKNLEYHLKEVIEWYRRNKDWWGPLKK